MLLAQDVKRLAQDTLKDETTTEAQKTAAQAAIRRINATTARAKGKPKRPKRREFASDADHAQALFLFRSTLDRLAIEREASAVLDDPASSVYLRRKAKEILYGKDPEPAEPVKPVESESPEKPLHSRLTADEYNEDRKRAQDFINSLGKPNTRAEVPTRQPETKKVQPPPNPVNHALYCEYCRAPFSICGCDKLLRRATNARAI